MEVVCCFKSAIECLMFAVVDRVLYLALSPDGQTIVTGAGDETLRFWNVFGGCGVGGIGDSKMGGKLGFPGHMSSSSQSHLRYPYQHTSSSSRRDYISRFSYGNNKESMLVPSVVSIR